MLFLKAIVLLGSICVALTAVSSSVIDESVYADQPHLLSEILQLKESVDATAKEHWAALQSLRFHLLSVRTGLKQALEEIRDMKHEMKGCTTAVNISLPLQPILAPEPVVTTPPPAECHWPAEMIEGRCLLMVTDELKTWDDAQEHCRLLGGSLATQRGFPNLRDHLIDLFGLGTEHRVRWSIWSGAEQSLNGWVWADGSCSSAEPVPSSVWAEYQPHATTEFEVTKHCMALDGFAEYKAAAVPCSVLRRYLCDLS